MPAASAICLGTGGHSTAGEHSNLIGSIPGSFFGLRPLRFRLPSSMLHEWVISSFSCLSRCLGGYEARGKMHQQKMHK